MLGEKEKAKDKNIALRKRQQIEKAGRTMFIWVAASSAVVGIAAVVSVSLFQQLLFNQKVIHEKNVTVGNLHSNNETANKLKDNVRVLNTNQNLLNTPRLEGAEPISAVLDALPSQPNSLALGASLEQRLLKVDGVNIESLVVDPISGIEGDSSASSSEDLGEGQIGFRFTVTAAESNIDALRGVLRNLEASIRAIDMTSITIERQGTRISLSGQGHAFYLPEKKVELTEKSVQP